MSSSIESLVNKEYQYGFVTDVESDTIAPGLTEDTVRLISSKKDEPEWLLEWRLKAFRRWQAMTEPHWSNLKYDPIDYQAQRYYSAPKSVTPLQSLDEVDPELLRAYDKLGISLSEQKHLAGVAVDAIFDSVSVGTTMKAELSAHGVVFCSFTEAVHNHPELVQQYLGLRGSLFRQFFRGAQLRRVLRRFVLLRAQGRALPDRTLDLLPHQRGKHRAVRAHAHRGRRRRVCQLPRRVHRAQARHEPAACRGGRTRRARQCDGQVLDRAELVRRRQGGKRRHLQLRHQARQGAREFEDLLDAGRDRFGDHLEVSERDPAGRQLDRRVLLGGRREQHAAGRHRHEDDPHRARTRRARSSRRASARGRGRTVTAAR